MFSITNSACSTSKRHCRRASAAKSPMAAESSSIPLTTWASAGVADEVASEEFSEAELDSTVLTQVHDALARIEAGTFGTCIVDGGPIEEKRLDALPWTPYCLKHARRLDTASKTSTM